MVWYVQGRLVRVARDPLPSREVLAVRLGNEESNQSAIFAGNELKLSELEQCAPSNGRKNRVVVDDFETTSFVVGHRHLSTLQAKRQKGITQRRKDAKSSIRLCLVSFASLRDDHE